MKTKPNALFALRHELWGAHDRYLQRTFSIQGDTERLSFGVKNWNKAAREFYSDIHDLHFFVDEYYTQLPTFNEKYFFCFVYDIPGEPTKNVKIDQLMDAHFKSLENTSCVNDS